MALDEVPTLRVAPRAPLLVPFLGLGLATIALCGTGAELAIAGLFYDAESRMWPLHGHPVLRGIDRYGIIPALVVAGAGLCAAAGSLCSRSLRSWRRPGIFLFAALVVGTLFLVNTCLKQFWDRPRPVELDHFSGFAVYRPVWELGGVPGMHKSFPSGHASAGFLMMAPGFVFYAERRRLALAFFAAGVIWGGMMGMSRILQGSHFVTDVLWAGGVTYAACARLALRMLPRPHPGAGVR
jgi:lipid A 4'-phosphatase